MWSDGVGPVAGLNHLQLLGEVRGDRAGRTPQTVAPYSGPAASRVYLRLSGSDPVTTIVSSFVR
jgi:hypothetical protein